MSRPLHFGPRYRKIAANDRLAVKGTMSTRFQSRSSCCAGVELQTGGFCACMTDILTSRIGPNIMHRLVERYNYNDAKQMGVGNLLDTALIGLDRSTILPLRSQEVAGDFP